MAEQAQTLAGVLGDDADLVTASAWLHDIGYSPALAHTGFHPLDGARYLYGVENADEQLCSLVAHHSGALVEAEERGMRGDLAGEFDLPRAELLEALTYSDMTTGPDGTHLPVEQRLSEILVRYEPGDIVHRSITRSSPDLIKAVRSIEDRLTDAR
ncbi:metal-dependent phosphohydrolase, HD subdomain protein [Nocardiopsis ansamitocini]|uniref:Metal-dependent phosphohydrolase, HD subdomain protein n=1 Tax=Nocardiopsis ansamitocini TaxID=1670832 RepID=A0A9W6P4L6_9ACTN|nr:metal-dependent phosphohydrolase, HD subdomain protein [Nocardiopsis ansamitocini]